MFVLAEPSDDSVPLGRPTAQPARRGIRSFAIAIAPATGLLLLGVAFFGSSGRDDSYLTYWPAHTLASSGRILNFNGQRVEQSSSLLHVLVLAALTRLTTVSIPALGWAVGIAGGVATVAVATCIARRIEPRAAWLAGAFAGTSAYLVYWSFSGLETSLAALCCLLAVLGASTLLAGPKTRAGAVAAVAAIASYATVRPEALVVLLAMVGGVAAIAAGGRRWRSVRPGGEVIAWSGLLRLVLVVTATGALLVGFRVAYFGDIVPQTVRAKISGVHPSDGWTYVRDWLFSPGMLIVLLVAGATIVQRRRRSLLEMMLWLMAASQLGFVIMSGGDWMEAGRMLVPFLAVVTTLAAVTVARTNRRAWIATVVIGLQLVGVVAVARSDSTGKPAWAAVVDGGDPAEAATLPFYEQWNRVHLRDGIFLDRVVDVVDRLHVATGRSVSVSSGQAGMVPYYLFSRIKPGAATFIDRGNLSGNAFNRCSSGLIQLPFGAGSLMTYGYWFRHLAECGLPKPDVVYELGTIGPSRPLAGYVVMYQVPVQTLLADSPRLPGTPVRAAQYVAVRADLAPLVNADG